MSKKGNMTIVNEAVNLVISFSGGETSGYMLSRILSTDLSVYSSVSVVFANTGEEHDETLIFVNKVAKLFCVDIVWIESMPYKERRKSSGYIIVDFDSASRKGEPFERVIDKYGIPNIRYLHCTRELKNNPIKNWCIDKFGKNYVIAIGIRLDEKARVPKINSYRTIYPLICDGMTKDDVHEFWSAQSFRLGIENYQGNCKWCWKKSAKKLKIIAHESPSVFRFPDRMEKTKGLCGHNVDGTPRVFFIGNKSAIDILSDAADPDFDYDAEIKEVVDNYNESLFEGGCSDSCEAFTQESLFDDSNYE